MRSSLLVQRFFSVLDTYDVCSVMSCVKEFHSPIMNNVFMFISQE